MDDDDRDNIKRMKFEDEEEIFEAIRASHPLIGKQFLDPRSETLTAITAVTSDGEIAMVDEGKGTSEAFCVSIIEKMVLFSDEICSERDCSLCNDISAYYYPVGIMNLIAETLAVCSTPTIPSKALFNRGILIDSIIGRIEAIPPKLVPSDLVASIVLYSCPLSKILTRLLTVVKFRIHSTCSDVTGPSMLIALELAKPPFLLSLSRARWLDMGLRRVPISPTDFPDIFIDSSDYPSVAKQSEGSATTASPEANADFSLEQRIDNLRKIHGNQILNGKPSNGGALDFSSQRSIPLTTASHRSESSQSVTVRKFQIETGTVFECSNFPFLQNTHSAVDSLSGKQRRLVMGQDISLPEEIFLSAPVGF